jgi:glycosyltransferase involved in cell wall biosynthesis
VAAPWTGTTREGGTVAVVLPVLDEREALPWVLGRMPAGYHPIVVDNGSGDGSGGLARRLGATVVDEPRRGFGSACHAGLEAAAGHELIAFLDADGSLDPADLPALVELVTGGVLDLALGARRPERGAWPVHARLANRWLARELRRRYGWAVTDLGPMRVARRDDLAGLGLSDRRSGWPLEMALRAGEAGWRVGERPVPYRARAGRSKVTGTVRGTVGAVRDMRRQLTSS